jgi:adenylate cyclase class 2
MEEIEVKFLEVDIPELEKKLLGLGAKKVGETVSRITNFDFPDYRLKAEHAWVRLRSEFGKTTLAYKQRIGASNTNANGDESMKEVEVGVEDFDKTNSLLLSIGMIEKFSQGRKRIRYTKDDVEFDIDAWPLIPPYLEIEGPSWDKVEKISRELGFNWDNRFIGSFSQVGKKYGIDDHDYKVFTLEEQIKK